MPKGVKIDNQKIADIITGYALTNSYSATSKECGVSVNSVKNIINRQKESNPQEFAKICKDKKESFIQKADRLIDKAMDRLDKALDEDNIPVNNLTTAIGTLVDKRRLMAGESTNNNTITVKMSDEIKELSK